MDEDVRWRLTEARRYGELAIVAAGRFDYEQDPIGMAAIAHLVEQVGEQFVEIHRGHERFVKEHPEVPWREVEGMRHRMAHPYGRVDPKVVRTVLEADLPELLRQVAAILGPGGRSTSSE